MPARRFFNPNMVKEKEFQEQKATTLSISSHCLITGVNRKEVGFQEQKPATLPFNSLCPITGVNQKKDGFQEQDAATLLFISLCPIASLNQKERQVRYNPIQFTLSYHQRKPKERWVSRAKCRYTPNQFTLPCYRH